MFTNLPWCSQSVNSLVYVYPIQIPSSFLWVLDHSRDCTSSYCHCPPQKILYYPLDTYISIPIRDSICYFFCQWINFCFLFSYHPVFSASPFYSIYIQFVVFSFFFIFWDFSLYFLLSFALTSFFFKYLLSW